MLWSGALAWIPLVIAQPVNPETPTFTRDILPILQETCQICHRPGQIAPMSFTNFREVRPWAKAIRKTVLERSMPPFAGAGPIGYYENDLRLTEQQIKTLVDWIDGGTLRGQPEDAPPPVDWPSGQGAITDPDLVLHFPSVTSDPDNEDHWVLIYSDHVFEKETWIESWELISTDTSLIHHSGVKAVDKSFYVPEERILHGRVPDLVFQGKEMGKNLNYMAQQTSLGLWLPGVGVQKRPGGVIRIGPGERVVLQAHIAPTEEVRTTDLSIRVRLAKGTVVNGLSQALVRFKDIEIQPGEADYTLRGARNIAVNGWLRSVRVHMHERGKSARVTLHYPSGERKIVLDIPRWDFDWQRAYHFAVPIYVPRGTKMEAVAVWDNSEYNPGNPDPTQLVKHGPHTSDEMFSAVAFLNFDRQSGPLIFEDGQLVSGDARIERAPKKKGLGKKKKGLAKLNPPKSPPDD